MLGDPLMRYPPRLNAAWFGAMNAGVLGDLHCATPYTAPRLSSTCFGAMNVGVLGEPLLCYPLHCT